MKNGKRQLLIGAVGLVKGNVREAGRAMVAVCDELEPELQSTCFLAGAPFDVVSLILRFGTKWGDEVEIGEINNRYRELEVAVELPMSEILMMDFGDLCDTFMFTTLRALIAVGKSYDLPIERWTILLAPLEARDHSGDTHLY